MAAVALICMTITSAVFTSCGDDKSETKTVVYYKYADVETLQCLQTDEGKKQAEAFATALAGVLTSIQSREVTDDVVIEMTQNVVNSYNYKMIEGKFKLQSSRNASDWSTVKKFTLTANSQYKN